MSETKGQLPTPADLFGPRTALICAHRKDEGIAGGLVDCIPWWARHGTPFIRVEDPHGGNIEVVRSVAGRRALELPPTFEWICFFDADQSPVNWRDLYQLASHGKDAVSGLVFSQNRVHGLMANVAFMAKNHPGRHPAIRGSKRLPAKGLKKAVFAGHGYLMVRRSVLERLFQGGSPYLAPQELREQACRDGYIRKTEDRIFVERLSEAGYELWVDFGVRAVHHKRVDVGWPAEWADQDLLADAYIPADGDKPLDG